MIERLLAAEAALGRGEHEHAGRLFAQVAEADPRNAIAVVGLARIAQREGRADEARELTERALAIDPDEAAAQRLLRELYTQAEPPPSTLEPRAAPATEPTTEPTTEIEPAPTPSPLEPAPAWPTDRIAPVGRPPSILARLRRWLAGLGRRG
jgi:tetratricopeptide (TPR) repeat protein